jgi:hypothetical protein
MFLRKKRDARVRLVEVMPLRRAYLPDPLNAEQAREFEEAKRRCLACRVKKLCDEALEKADANAFALFCPNSHYMQYLRSEGLLFR